MFYLDARRLQGAHAAKKPVLERAVDLVLTYIAPGAPLEVRFLFCGPTSPNARQINVNHALKSKICAEAQPLQNGST